EKLPSAAASLRALAVLPLERAVAGRATEGSHGTIDFQHDSLQPFGCFNCRRISLSWVYGQSSSRAARSPRGRLALARAGRLRKHLDFPGSQLEPGRYLGIPDAG